MGHLINLFLCSIMLNGNEIGGPTLDQGGVYNLLVARDPKTNRIRSNLYTVTTPNSIHILWQVPQYFVITASEVMFSVTGDILIRNLFSRTKNILKQDEISVCLFIV